LCGASENLQLDHEDTALKVSHHVWSWSKARREAELAKCRPLCAQCHKTKSATEQLKGEARLQNVKLTNEIVLAIRASGESDRNLGARYGVHWVTISKIRRRVLWKHI
jgi:hypothetical protein